MSRGPLIFLVENYPSLDHTVPVIWACLERGERAVLVFDAPFPQKDFRIQFLRRYAGFDVVNLRGVASRSRLVRLASRLWWFPWRIARWLREQQAAACFVDWGTALYESHDGRVASGFRGIRETWTGQWNAAAFRNAVASVVPTFRTALLVAARQLGLPVFCIPHGAVIILKRDYSLYLPTLVPEAAAAGRLRLTGFTAYVAASQRYREAMVEILKFDASVPQLWGIIRYSPPWIAVTASICPKPAWPERWRDHTRLLFVLPKWHEGVDRAGALSLLAALAARPGVAIVCKAHPRLGVDARPDLTALLARPNVWSATDEYTSALVAGTAATIVLSSSVAIDALQQGKPVIYPRYLHQNRLLFDLLGGCLIGQSQEEILQLVDALVAGATPAVSAADVDRVISEVVYAGRPPYDVPAYYHARIREHLEARRPEAVGSTAAGSGSARSDRPSR